MCLLVIAFHSPIGSSDPELFSGFKGDPSLDALPVQVGLRLYVDEGVFDQGELTLQSDDFTKDLLLVHAAH